MDALVGLLLLAFTVSVAVATVYRVDAKRFERERDDAMGRAVQAETAANRLFDRYSETKRDMIESKVPTVPRLQPSRPPTPPRPRGGGGGQAA